MVTDREEESEFHPLEDFKKLQIKTDLYDSSFISQHKPSNLDGFIGNKEEILNVRKWLDESNNSILLVFGPCGVGKSLLLELLEKEYDYSYSRIPSESSPEEVLKYIEGKHEYNIIDSFKNVKRPQRLGWFLDDLGCYTSYRLLLENIQKSLYKTGYKVLAMCDLRLMKKFTKISNINTIKFSRVCKEDLKELVKKVCLKERKRVPKDFNDTIFKGSNGDVRGTLQSLELSLRQYQTKPNGLELLDMTRDQYYFIHDAINSVLNPETHFNARIRLSETDTYSMAYSLHENYPSFFSQSETNWNELCNVIESFSIMDAMSSELCDTAAAEITCGVAIPGTILSHHDKPDEFRNYKIISNSNQSIISKNKIDTAKIKISPIGWGTAPPHEFLDIAKLYLAKKENVSDLRWFSTRFKKQPVKAKTRTKK